MMIIGTCRSRRRMAKKAKKAKKTKNKKEYGSRDAKWKAYFNRLMSLSSKIN
jgi:hypothetical protein